MKRKIFIKGMLLTFLLGGMLNAQSLERRVVATGGASGSAASLQLDYTIGELAVATGSSGNVVVTQGFQQGSTGSVGIQDPVVKADLVVFPNPAKDEISLRGTVEGHSKATLQLWDALGKLVGEKELGISGGQIDEIVDLSGLAAGQYHLSLLDDGNLIGYFKVRKIQ